MPKDLIKGTTLQVSAVIALVIALVPAIFAWGSFYTSVQANQESDQSQEARLQKIEDQLSDVKYIKEQLTEIKTDVKDLKNRP